MPKSSKQSQHRGEQQKSENHHHKLGVTAATAYLVGDIIGSGIFITPQGILNNTGSIGLSLIVWAICGVLSLIGALCYVELGTSIPLSGGDFAYLCYVRWYPVAFAFLWTTFIIYKPCSIAILVKTFGNYVLQALSPLLCFTPSTFDGASKLIGFLLLLLLTALNFYRLTKFASKIQIIITSCKIGSLVLIIAVGIYWLGAYGTKNIDKPFEGTRVQADFIWAIYGGLWAYDGWDTLNFGVEELRNPRRTLLLAVFGGTVIVTIVYLLSNVAYFAVLGKEAVLESEAVAQSFSQVSLGWFAYAIPLIVGIVIMGTINASLFSSSRYFFAAARQGHMPGFMKLLNVYHQTPQPALVIYTIMAIIMANVAGVDDLIKYVVFVIWLQRVFVIAALIMIRVKKINVDKKAIRMPLILHVIFLLITMFVVAAAAYQAPLVCLVGVGVAVSGLIIYFLLVYPKKLPDCLLSVDVAIMKMCQVIFLCMPEDLSGKMVTGQKATKVDPKSETTSERIHLEKF